MEHALLIVATARQSILLPPLRVVTAYRGSDWSDYRVAEDIVRIHFAYGFQIDSDDRVIGLVFCNSSGARGSQRLVALQSG